MMMNLTGLFEVQRKLDAEIERKHPIQPMEDRFEKKKLALLVEIGELANEVRTWKFWSKDKKPRYEKHHTNGVNGEWWITYPLLEEYIDVLHFLLSIGNEYAEYMPEFYRNYNMEFEKLCDHNDEYFAGQFTGLFRTASRLGGGLHERFHAEADLEYYDKTFQLFIGLGEMLGFTWEQITDAYTSKNKTNWDRQANGY